MFKTPKNVLRIAIKLSFVVLVSVLMLTVYVSIVHVASQAVNVEIGPSHIQQVTPGQEIIYNHVLTNTGIVTDTFLVKVLSTQGWPVELTGENHLSGTTLLPVEVSPQMTVSFQVSVTVPLDAAGMTEITIITATSQISPTVLDTTTDTSIVLGRVYLPLVLKRWPPVPYKPSLNVIQGADDGNYTVNWSELPSRLANTYTLQESTDATFTENVNDVCITALQSCAINGKLAGTYYYRVRGQNSWGNSEWSNVQAANVLLPDVPILNAVENADGNGDYIITWGATARATGYTLEEATTSDFNDARVLYSGTDQSWSVTGQPYGTYYYRVAAIGSTGQSGWSNTQVVTVVPPVEVVEHNGHQFVYWYREGSTWIDMYCEVRNNTQRNITNVALVANVYDANGTLIATDTGYSMVEVIRPAQTSPVEFSFDVPGGGDGIKNGEVKITIRDNWSYTTKDTQNTFELISHSSFKDSYGALHVVGESKNIGTTTEDLKVTVLIRGKGQFQDMVLAAGYDLVWDVFSNEVVSFDETFWKDFGDAYDHYEIILEQW